MPVADFDVQLHAEKAAFEGLNHLALFNSLQARAAHALSPETVLFAKVCYEKQLVRYVATALIECARSLEGRAKAEEILNTAELTTIQAMWKPLLVCCSKLLRSIKMETTSSRLSRLNDLWKTTDYGEQQAIRLRNVVQEVIFNSNEGSQIACEDILDRIELHSVPDVPILQTPSHVREEFKDLAKSMIIVNISETFSEAESFLRREVERDAIIHVIVGNEDDSVRFYRRIVDEFPNLGIQLNWREKTYGEKNSPKIIVGSTEYHISKYCEVSGFAKQPISAVVLHAERDFENSFVLRFRPGCLDDYITKLHILCTTTFEHFREIESSMPNVMMQDLIDSWPRENQIFEADHITDTWRKCYSVKGSSCKMKFTEYMRPYIQKKIKKRIVKFKVRSNLEQFVKSHRSAFVQSAMVAREAVRGQDYVVYADRSSGQLKLRIRLKSRLNEDFGLLQFLELRHGCAMTPYRIPMKSIALFSVLDNYERLLIIQRSNPFRDYITQKMNIKMKTRLYISKPTAVRSTIPKFATSVQDEIKSFKDSLTIIVCNTTQIMLDTFYCLQYKNVGNVIICETALGVSNESAKFPTGNLVVCTTAVCFEGWTFIPRTRKRLKIIVCHTTKDKAALETAFDLAYFSEIRNVIVADPEGDRIRQLNKGREGTKLWVIFAKISEEFLQPDEIIDKYVNDANESRDQEDDINDLLEDKRKLHEQLRHLTSAAKMIHAQLPVKKWETKDSPMDIACTGFLEQSRLKIKEYSFCLRKVEWRLSNHVNKFPVVNVTTSEGELENIANRYRIDEHRLAKVLRTAQSGETWTDLKAKVCLEFKLDQDATNHWNHCYVDREGDEVSVIALSGECASAATSILLRLEPAPWPNYYRKKYLQQSDRHLDDCKMYVPEDGFDVEELDAWIEKMDGASIECFHPKSTTGASHQLLKEATLLENVVKESLEQQYPMYLFPRRCYDRLTRDLFDSGLVVCADYDSPAMSMNERDTIQLAVIPETKPLNDLERHLRTDSALMEYGSLEWMEWLARRLRLYKYDPQIARFYHKTVAEREYCMQDERLIRRLRDSLTEPEGGHVLNNFQQMQMDAFVYSTMDILQRGERLVVIAPPFSSNHALQQLTHFIRSLRMPPAVCS